MEWYKATSQGRERIGASIGRVNLTKYLNDVVKPLGLEAVEDPAQRKKFWSAGNFYSEG